VLSTGFAGGYFFASPDHDVPPNRLQRVASGTTATKDADAKAASVTIPRGDVVEVDQAEPPPGRRCGPFNFFGRRWLLAPSQSEGIRTGL